MLVQFTVSNFYSLRRAAELSLLEAKITEFPETLIRSRQDAYGILPAAMLYGANGSGKSNVLYALAYLRALIFDPAGHMGEAIGFMGSQEPTAFDVVLRNDKNEYEYMLSIHEGKVMEETLYGRSLSKGTYDVLFDRDAEGVYLGELLEALDVTPLTDDMPMLSFAFSGMPPKELEQLRELFSTLTFADCSDPGDEILTRVLDKESASKLLLKVLSAADTGITAIEPGSLTRRGIPVAFSRAGGGLMQLVRMAALAVDALEEGYCLLADDFSQKLHPKALKLLIGLFTQPKLNKTGAQLIATSYDMPTMANSVLRRDEIWLCHMDEEGETSLYTLALFLKENGEKVRKDETYYKQFLEGRYGTDVNCKAVK